ncbi:MAG: magnesium transporter CorA family protein [Anaerolineaceae bacterium]|nr:magnesium transporter CorA family protein [Anaerolineaceae bacterium]
MLNIYKTVDNELQELEEIVKGCWINVINPNEKEIERILSLGIPNDFVTNALDINERSRTEKEEAFTLIIIRIPYYKGSEVDIPYIAIPVGIIVSDTWIMTICRNKNDLINRITKKNRKKISTVKRNSFILRVMLSTATLFLDSLRKIKKAIDIVEDELQLSVRNKEVLELLKFQKSLEYLSTALKSNELMFERLQRSKFFAQYQDDAELLEDVITENQQAIEMTSIASNLLMQMMDAFASIIQNNQNIV